MNTRLIAARAALLAAALSVAGCSLTLPVRGQYEGSGEAFTGSATGYTDGSGVLTVKAARGLSCTGNFVYVTRRQGEGVFSCNDGRSGPFQFASTGSRGTGTGTLGAERFTFTFGD